MENHKNNNPLGHLTIPARLLVMAAIVLFPIGTTLLIVFAYHDLPSGSYPIWFFSLPVLIGMFFFVLIGFQVLNYLGIPVYIENHDDSQEESNSDSNAQ